MGTTLNPNERQAKSTRVQFNWLWLKIPMMGFCWSCSKTDSERPTSLINDQSVKYERDLILPLLTILMAISLL